MVAANLGGDVAAAEVRAAISAAVTPDTSNIVLTATNPDRVLARDIAQGYAEALSDLAVSSSIPDNKTESLVTARIVDNAVVSNTPVSPEPVRNLGLGIVLGLLAGRRARRAARAARHLDLVVRRRQPPSRRPRSSATSTSTPPRSRRIRPSRWRSRPRGQRPSGCCGPTCSSSRWTTATASSSSPAPCRVRASPRPSSAWPSRLAMAGQRVALVDCDLRRPMIADRLGLDSSVGTTSVLIGQVAYEDAMQSYGDTGLDVMTCGPRPPNPSELLQSQAMEKLIVNLRETYDIVLLDAPPLLPVTDGALLAAQSDGMLAVVRHGKTSRDQLAHALERIEQVDSKCVGVVINMAPAKKGSRATLRLRVRVPVSVRLLGHRGAKPARKRRPRTRKKRARTSSRRSTKGRHGGRLHGLGSVGSLRNYFRCARS